MENQAISAQSVDIPEYEDVATSSETYASRFAGKTGSWLLKVQAEITKSLLRHTEVEIDAVIEEVLDVAGGHAQVARVLHELRKKVVVVGSSRACEGQLTDLLSAGTCTFQVCNLLHMPLADRAYPVVTCFRFLPHCDEWRSVIAELCRVSAHSVIVDYPPRASFNSLYPVLFGVKRQLEGNTRHFSLFSHQEIDQEFSSHGFERVESRAEFFWPMVLHRVLNLPVLSGAMEILPRLSGLTSLFGSPVIARFRRR